MTFNERRGNVSKFLFIVQFLLASQEFLISSFRRVLNVVCFLLGNYPKESIQFSRINPHGLVTYVCTMNHSWRNLIKIYFLMSETTDAEDVFCSAFIYKWAGFFSSSLPSVIGFT